MNNINILFDYNGHLPECPTWCEQSQSLYWTDILEKQIHRYDLLTKKHHVLHFSEEVGSFALRESNGFICAMRTGIYLTDLAGQLDKKICDNPNNPALARFNDGGVDQFGRFYAGTYWSPKDFNGALLCRIDSQLNTKVIQADILGANGLAFSPDKQWMYTTDTPNRVMYRTPLNEYGDTGTREIFKQFTPDYGRPDGAAMDIEGCYWVAMFNGSKVIRISPNGDILAEYPVPVKNPTMVCFGGSDMKTLFITSGRENMSASERAASPLSGCIFTLQTNIEGMLKPRFKEAESQTLTNIAI